MGQLERKHGRENMRVFLVLSAVLLAVLAHPDYSDSWEEFKEKYTKQYESNDEETYRAGVWNNNVVLIKAHNLQADQDEITYYLGENEFADLTTDEINAFYNGISIEVPVAEPMEEIDVSDLPADVDWRNKSIVTDIKDQKQCGSCWAFSTTGSLEGQHAIKTKKLVSLSEQNLVDCSMKQGNHGCMGGLMDFAFKYIKDNKGIDTEASYPYTAKTGKKCLYNATNSGANLTSWVDVKRGSETDLQKAVATVGPVSVAIDASRPTFHFYKKGIYHDFFCSSSRLDHGVLAVGYGSANETAWGPKDFWLVKNSWGKTWGQAGYINMARNWRNTCGIATQASYPVV